MRNSDFKALLTTPRTTAGGAQQQQKEGSSFKHPRPKVPADLDRDKKFKKPHPKRPGKPGQPGDKQKEGAEEPLYRWGAACDWAAALFSSCMAALTTLYVCGTSRSGLCMP